jgi:hypothetical protein
MKSGYYYVCNNSFLGKVVHQKGCKNLRENEKTFLGTFYGYSQALAIAKQRYPEVDQCQECLELKDNTRESPAEEDSEKFLSSSKRPEASPTKVPVSELKTKSTGHIKRVPRKHSSRVF